MTDTPSSAAMEVQSGPRIVVVGLGGAGGNAVDNMMRAKLEGVEFIAANTDAQALEQSLCERRIQLGRQVTRGLGAGSRPEVGRAATEEALAEIEAAILGANMVFITAGMGGGTGTGGAPVIAEAARAAGVLTVGVVTKPFHFEGARRMRLAEAGVAEIGQHVDTLIVIPNQNLFRVADEKTTFADAFRIADEVLHAGVRGVTDLMVMPGLINLDFADIRSVMAEMGKAIMGTGEAEGAERAVRAAEAAISNPLLDEVSMHGARGVLINIAGSLDLTLFEVDQAANRIREEVDPEANIIFGSVFDQRLEGRMRVSVVATGIEAEGQRPQPVPLSLIVSRSIAEKTARQQAPAAQPAAEAEAAAHPEAPPEPVEPAQAEPEARPEEAAREREKAPVTPAQAAPLQGLGAPGDEASEAATEGPSAAAASQAAEASSGEPAAAPGGVVPFESRQPREAPSEPTGAASPRSEAIRGEPPGGEPAPPAPESGQEAAPRPAAADPAVVKMRPAADTPRKRRPLFRPPEPKTGAAAEAEPAVKAKAEAPASPGAAPQADEAPKARPKKRRSNGLFSWLSGGGAGSAEEHFEKGDRFYYGQGVRKNLALALRAYRKAADLGHAAAQNRLGWMYEKGEGVDADYTEAVSWYRRAAEHGHVNAMNDLGYMYRQGWGVPQSYSEALRWFRKAADKYDSYAEYNMGQMYENGWGVEKDPGEAIRWFRRSAARGHEWAAKRLEELGVKT